MESGEAEDDIIAFNYKLLMSGYTEFERMQINKEGRARYWNLVRDSSESLRPLYRRSGWEKLARSNEKFKKGRSWFGAEKSGYTSIQSTPGEILKSKVEEIMSSQGFSIAVKERIGRTTKQMLQKSDVSRGGRCHDLECVVCLSGGSKCCKESVGYEVVCKECVDQRYIMHGETGRTAKIRCGEHSDNLRNEKGGLWEHCVAVHDGEKVDFKFRVSGVFGDPLLRQLDEAQRIERESGVLLNAKEEWIRPAGYRTEVSRM